LHPTTKYVAKTPGGTLVQFSTGVFCLAERRRKNKMNNVTFKILERQNGEFVLFLHNHGQKLVCEQFRSRNLQAVVDCLREKMITRKHFQNAIANYAPVISAVDALFLKYPQAKNESFPKDWKDPLELYGCYQEELGGPEKERKEFAKLLEKKTPEYVWENRLSLVGQRLYLRNCFGDVL